MINVELFILLAEVAAMIKVLNLEHARIQSYVRGGPTLMFFYIDEER